MKHVLSILTGLVATVATAICQWTEPRLIDSASVGSSVENLLLSVAVAPNRDLAVIVSESDTLRCYYSSDNGRNFSRSIVATGYYQYLRGAYIERVDASAFDSQSNLYVLFLYIDWDDAVGWAYFKLTKSADRGKTFKTFWSSPVMVGSWLIRGALVVDSADRIHLVWDNNDEYHYTSFPANDSSNVIEAVLPAPLGGSIRPGCAISPHGDTVRIALGALGPNYSSGLQFVTSTDGGMTFSPSIPIDTPEAHYPFFHQLSSERLSVIHTVPSNYDRYSDTALVIQTCFDSAFSAPRLLLGLKKSSVSQPIIVRSRGASVYTAYSSNGIAYYELRDTDSVPIDSLFLEGHSDPDLAVDSLGGKYLVSVYDNRPYLTTKDVVLHVTEDDGTPGLAFKLLPNYPNPFNPTTIIRYEILQTSWVKLTVYDILGREVSMPVNAIKPAGVHDAMFDGSRLSSGVYIYRLQAGSYIGSKKMLLLK